MPICCLERVSFLLRLALYHTIAPTGLGFVCREVFLPYCRPYRAECGGSIVVLPFCRPYRAGSQLISAVRFSTNRFPDIESETLWLNNLQRIYHQFLNRASIRAYANVAPTRLGFDYGWRCSLGINYRHFLFCSYY
jgi:hypothetical protein